MIIGFAGTLIFGVQAIQDTETVSFLGVDIGVSGANWTPVIVSAAILVIGVVMMSIGKRGHAD